MNLCLQISWLAANFEILSGAKFHDHVKFPTFFHIFLPQKPILHRHPPSGRTVERCPDSGWKIPARLAWNHGNLKNIPPKFRTAAASPQKKGTSTKLHQFCSGSLICALWKRKHISSTKTPPIFGFHVNSNWWVVGYRKFNSFGGWTFTLKLNPCTDWFKLVVIGCFLWYVAGNLSNRSQSNRKNHPLKGAGCPVHPRKTNMNMKKRQFWRCISYEKWVIFYCQPCWFTGGIPKVTPYLKPEIHVPRRIIFWKSIGSISGV